MILPRLDFRGNGLSYGFIGNEQGDHFSSLLIDYLKNNGDPRLTMIATPKTSSSVVAGAAITTWRNII